MLNNLTADDLNTLEPQRQNNGRIVINGLDSADKVTLAASAVPLPKRAIGIIEVFQLNERRKYAGNPTYDDLAITFTDFIDIDLANILNKWWTQVYNSVNGKIGFARSYKKTGFIEMFAPNGSYDRGYDLFGMWPSNFDGGDLDKEGEDKVRITLTLTIDKAQPRPTTASGSYTTD
jgi:hypothetical protein